MEKTPKQGEQLDSQLPEQNQSEGVVFLGWQKTVSGEKLPLYNVIAEGHPLYGSTVSDKTLRAHNLPVPENPSEGE